MGISLPPRAIEARELPHCELKWEIPANIIRPYEKHEVGDDDMDTLFLGKMIAPYLFVSGLGFLFSVNFYEKLLINSDKSDPLTVNLSGMVHFFIGLAIVLNHHIWSNVLEILITLVGFGFLIKGLTLIVIPNSTLKSTKVSVKLLRISGIGFLAVGSYLGYMSYFA